MKKKPSKAKGILLLAFVVFAVVVGALVVRKYETATRIAEPPPQTAPEAPAGTVVVSLFFAAADADKLAREGREVEVEESVEAGIESVVDELIGGPLGSLSPTLPPNTRLLGVTLKGELAQIDFGPELAEGLPEGSSAEMMTVYSIVDTVAANFPQVKSVQILINGVAPETLKGHLDLRNPLAPDFSLEKKAENAEQPEAAAKQPEKPGRPETHEKTRK